MHPKEISINDYTYTLPEEKIAPYPSAERGASRLLIYKDETTSESYYNKIDEFIPAESLLIFNNTRVVEARLLFQKTSGGIIEIFCLEPGDMYADVTTGMQQQGKVQWKCLVGGASKWKAGQVLQKDISSGNENIQVEARYIEKKTDYFIIELQWQPTNLSFAEILHFAGAMPLPPYIKRTAENSDKERYQTVYAKQDGSVAAPTAGLHFTPAILQQLQRKNIQQSFVTLHVGAGTFKPVKSATMQDHEMHAEFIEVQRTTIEAMIQYAGNIIAVGTTSARTIESLYWMGVKTILSPDINEDQLPISQWEVYDSLQAHAAITISEALNGLLQWMDKKGIARLFSKTQIIIAPGYSFKVIRGLITNFHQPQSTLLLLVAALTGSNWRNIYNYALENNFRFLSYGDGCLLLSY